MGSFMERSGNSASYFYENDGTATLAQGHLVLEPNVLVFGGVVDSAGILADAIGEIECYQGNVYQCNADQLDDDIVTLARLAPIYMAPGHGNLHATPAAGDWCIGCLYEAQGTNTYIKVQTRLPFAVEEET